MTQKVTSMNQLSCRTLIKREKGLEQLFQHALRRVIVGLLTSDEGERHLWTECISEGVDISLRLGLSYENYVNLMLLAACSKSPRVRATISELLLSSELHKKCVNHYITQSQSIIEDTDDWKWAALCEAISLIKFNFGAEQYIVQQAAHQLIKIIHSCGLNTPCISVNTRLRVDRAVFCIARLHEMDPTLHRIIAATSFSALLKLLESLVPEAAAPASSEMLALVGSRNSVSASVSHRVWVEMMKTAVLSVIRKLLTQDSSVGLTVPLAEALAGLISMHWHQQACSLLILKAYLVNGFHMAPRCAPVHMRSSSSKDLKSATQLDQSRLKSHGGERSGKGVNGARSAVKADSGASATNRSVVRVEDTNPRKKGTGVARSYSVAAMAGAAQHSTDGHSILSQLCANGHLRLLCWALVHCREEIRFLGAEILIICYETLKKNETDAKFVSDFWASLVEQGIVVVLYTVCAGVPLACREAAGRKELSSPFVVFPEQFIRDVAAALLSTLAREVVETPQLVDRLSYALVFTRNIKLRGNIFASVLMLVADSVELRRVLWVAAKPASGDIVNAASRPSSSEGADEGALFRMMLETAQHDPGEFRVITEVLLHRIQWAQAANIDSGNSQPLSPGKQAQADNVKIDSLSSRLSSGGYVWVMSPHLPGNAAGAKSRKPAGHPVDMQSPPLSLIHWHSATLGNIIQELQTYWDGLGMKPQHSGSSYFAKEDIMLLPGEYEIWEEIFSHMLDDYLLRTALPRLSVNKLIKLCLLADQYDMTVLRKAYVSALTDRMDVGNIIEIFECSLSSSAPVKFMALQQACLSFVGQHIEVLLSRKHKDKMGLIIKFIHQHIRYIFFGQCKSMNASKRQA